MATGFVFLFLVAPLLQAFAIVVFVFSTAPILVGLSDSALWSFPWRLVLDQPWFILKTIVLMLVFYVLLSFVPIIGSASSFGTFVMGAFALFALTDAAAPFGTEHLDFVPDIFPSIGYILISAFIGWTAFMLVVGLFSVIDKEEKWLPILAMPLASVVGLIPILFYGGYLGLQM